MRKITSKSKLSVHRAFTLVEMLVVIGLIALLATITLMAVNPGRQFAFARDAERKAGLLAILNAISQDMAENGGIFKCGGNTFIIPQSTTTISSGNVSPSGFDVAPCLVPQYLKDMPYDPSTGYYHGLQDYQTNYSIIQDSNNHISIFQNSSELNPNLPIVVSR
jgi:type IV pilus assembly protein PilA